MKVMIDDSITKSAHNLIKLVNEKDKTLIKATVLHILYQGTSESVQAGFLVRRLHLSPG